VQRYGGQIVVASEEGQGTTMTVTLPASARA
jgi:signal transduction histidine kinase